MVEENRKKRLAVKPRKSLIRSDEEGQEVRNLLPISPRTYTLDSEFSGMSPTGSPHIPQTQFDSVDWGHFTPSQLPGPLEHSPSASTGRSRLSTSPARRLSPDASEVSTAETTPDDSVQPLRTKSSPRSLAWNRLCRKVVVQRRVADYIETKECDLHWRYRKDNGISIRSVYQLRGKVHLWMTQHFPATGPSIPSTTSKADGEMWINFPQDSFGKLEKGCTDIKYIFKDRRSSEQLQQFLYTNDGKVDAELLYDRLIRTISSDLNKPECRAKNVRLWRKKETRVGPNGLQTADVLLLLFYTNALENNRAHWVEESHYAFEWLDDSVYRKSSHKLQLTFSKEPGKWWTQKMVGHRDSSKFSDKTGHQQEAFSPTRSGTASSPVTSAAVSVQSGRSIFGAKPNAAGNLNRFGYSRLDIDFKYEHDRMDFLKIWRVYARPLIEHGPNDVLLKRVQDTFPLSRFLDEGDSAAQPTPINTDEQMSYDKQRTQLPILNNADTTSEKSGHCHDCEDDDISNEVSRARIREVVSKRPRRVAPPIFGPPFSLYMENLRGFFRSTPKVASLQENLQLDVAQTNTKQSFSNHSGNEHSDVTEVSLEAPAGDDTQLMCKEDRPTTALSITTLQNLISWLWNFIVPQVEIKGKSYDFLPSLPFLIDVILRKFPLLQSEPSIPEKKLRARWSCVGHPACY